jgi:hypothetical protein
LIPSTEWTVGAIAAHHGVPVHKVEYVIASRGLAPQSRAGVLRIFSDEDVAFIGEALRACQERTSKSRKVSRG